MVGPWPTLIVRRRYTRRPVPDDAARGRFRAQFRCYGTPGGRPAARAALPRIENHDRAGSVSSAVDQRAKREREKIGGREDRKDEHKGIPVVVIGHSRRLPRSAVGRPGSDSRGVLKRARRARALSTASRFGRRRSRPTPRPAPKLEQSRNRPIGLPSDLSLARCCSRPCAVTVETELVGRLRGLSPSNPRGAQGLEPSLRVVPMIFRTRILGTTPCSCSAATHEARSAMARDGDVRLEARLVEGVRIDGKPRQRFIVYIGSIEEPYDSGDRVDFWESPRKFSTISAIGSEPNARRSRRASPPRCRGRQRESVGLTRRASNAGKAAMRVEPGSGLRRPPSRLCRADNVLRQDGLGLILNPALIPERVPAFEEIPAPPRRASASGHWSAGGRPDPDG